eukprot:649792-Rhodomonas_salina.2
MRCSQGHGAEQSGAWLQAVARADFGKSFARRKGVGGETIADQKRPLLLKIKCQASCQSSANCIY